MKENHQVIFQTFTKTVRDIVNKSISSEEVLKSVLGNISEQNSTINAIVTLDAKSALKQSKETDMMLAKGKVIGPLHGIPITIKDNFEVSGMRSTASHKPFYENIPKKDATAVARLRGAGAIIIGKTNLPELAADFQTNSPLFGRTNNPWDLNRTPGGSTGGGAAAVAAGMSFLELGNDMLGSIRIPAHFCGIHGFVPTINTVPRAGMLPKTFSGGTLDHFVRTGILARSVEDIITGFNVIKGPDDMDLNTMPLNLSQRQTKNTDKLKIAWIDSAPGVPVSKDIRNAMGRFMYRLKNEGHTVEKVDEAAFNFALAAKVFAAIFYTTIGVNMPGIIRMAARFAGRNKYFNLSIKNYCEAEAKRFELINNLESFFSRWDILICPVTSTTAFHHQKPSRYMGRMPVYRQGIKVDD
ncbi:MAG: amidase, partial [Bacillota bacterium]